MKRITLLFLSAMCCCSSAELHAQEIWKSVPGDARWSGHFIDGVQVGAKNASTGEYWALDPRTGIWSRSRAASANVIASPGLKREMMRGGESFSIDGKPSSEWEVKAMLASNENVPADSDKFSLTVIGPASAREQVARDLATHPALLNVRGKYVLQCYEPSDPMVARAGFVTNGQPSIYLQLADGQVLARSDHYETPDVLADAIQKAWEIQNRLTRPDDSYRPDKDTSILRFARPAWWEWRIVQAIARSLLTLLGLVVVVVAAVGFVSGRLSKGPK